MKSKISTLLILAAAQAIGATNSKVLDAIAQVESGGRVNAIGDAHQAFGKFQMHTSAWQTANAWLKATGGQGCPMWRWREEAVQDKIATAYLDWLRSRFAAQGILAPTPEQLALAWNIGFEASRRIGFDTRLASSRSADYAQRVDNLCR